MATLRKRAGRWQVQIRRQGHAPASRTFMKRADADAWARQTEAEIDRTGVLHDLRPLRTVTLADVLTRYSQEISPQKRSGASERLRITAIIRRPISRRYLIALSSSDIAQYRDERLQTVSAGTVIRELNTISHALDTAKREWGIHLPSNPVKVVRRPAAPTGRTRRLRADEEERILSACDRGRTPLLKPLIILALETAMRRSELLGLRWRDIDFSRRLASLTLTKNGEPREVPLSRTAIEVLQSLCLADGSADRVFPMTGHSVWLAWEHLRQRAGSPDLHFHDLRHEAVSRLVERGLSIPEVALISGHKDLRQLFRYTHLRPEDVAAKLQCGPAALMPMTR
jgi:integrase